MRKRRKHAGTWIAILLLAAVVCFVLFRFVFVVRYVDVQGNIGTLSTESVVRAAKVDFGASIFGIDVQRIRDHLNATGSLQAEDVQLQYPDTVRISVNMRSRDAMVLHLGKIRVLDENGHVIESMDQVPNEDLIYVSGMRINGYNTGEVIRTEDAQLQAYRAVIGALKRHAAGIYVSELNLNNPANMVIVTRTGITVQLGDAQNMHNKIAWMKSAVHDLEVRGERGGTLDVSSGTKADYRSAGN